MLKIAQTTPIDVFELPLAAMSEYPGAAVAVDRHGTSVLIGGPPALVESLRASGRWAELATAAAGPI